MAEPVRVRRLTGQEGQKLQQITALTACGKERARIRGEKGIRWGGRPLRTAA